MTTLKQLEARQRQELAEYISASDIRMKQLIQDQQKLLDGLSAKTPEIQGMLNDVLHEQREGREQQETEAMEGLKHIHSLERENFLETKAKQEELTQLLAAHRSSAKDHDRA